MDTIGWVMDLLGLLLAIMVFGVGVGGKADAHHLDIVNVLGLVLFGWGIATLSGTTADIDQQTMTGFMHLTVGALMLATGFRHYHELK